MAQAVHRSPTRKILRIVGNMWVGMALLGVMAVYLSIVSVFTKSAMIVLGTPELGLYGHPLLVVPALLACVNLIAATLDRVRFRLDHLGALLSHTGLLLLAGGCIWYATGRHTGTAVTSWTPVGWTPIDGLYLGDTYTVYAQTDDAREPVGTDLAIVPPVEMTGRDGLDLWMRKHFKGLVNNPAGKVKLDVPLAGLPDGVVARAKAFYPYTKPTSWAWENDWPAPAKAIELHVMDPMVGQQPRSLTLSRRLPRQAFFRGSDYVLYYDTRLDPEVTAKLARLTRPADKGGEDLPCVLIWGTQSPLQARVYRPGAPTWEGRLETGNFLSVPLGHRKLGVRLARVLEHAARKYTLEPLHAKPHPGQESVSAVEIELTSGNETRTFYIPYDTFDVNMDPQVVPLDKDSKRTVRLSFSARRVPLGDHVQFRSAEFLTHPGTHVPKDYRSELTVGKGSEGRDETLSLNHPVQVGPYQLSQSNWSFFPDGRRPAHVFLTVGSRPGLWLIWLGCWLICLGFPYAFYVKPLLRRARRRASS